MKVIQHVCDSTKINACSGLLCNKVTEPFFFTSAIIIGNIYFDVLENFSCPSLQADNVEAK
jgi:hypothetical protein